MPVFFERADILYHFISLHPKKINNVVKNNPMLLKFIFDHVIC